MQMKNLLRLMGSLALSTGAITSVVACGQQTAVNLDTVLKETKLGNVPVANLAKPTVDEIKNAIKNANKAINLAGIKVEIANTNDSAVISADGTIYNGNDITVTFTLVHKKTDQDITTDITTALQQGVDGSTLNDSQKQSAAEMLITAAMKVVTDNHQVGAATFTFEDGNQPLGVGDNTVKIKVTFGQSKDVPVNVKLTGVTAHKNNVEIKNPIGNKQIIEKELFKTYINFYQSLNSITKALFKIVAEQQNMTGYQYYKFLLKTDVITIPAV